MSNLADRKVEVLVSAKDAASAVFRKVGGEADDMAGKVQKGGINFQAAGAAMSAAGGVIVGGLVASAKAAGDYGGQIYDATRKTGMAAQDLTALKFAAEQSGVGFDQLTGAIAKQARTAVAAKDGTGPMADAYRQLGVSVTDTSGQMKDGNTLFLQTAEALKNIPNPSERAALAMQVFGKSGAQMLPLLMEGQSGIATMEQKARDLGLTMTDEAARIADDAGDRMEAAQASISMAWKSIGATVLPVLATIADSVATVVGHMARWSQEHPTLAKGLTLVVGGVGALMAAVGPLLIVLPSLKAGLAILGIGKVATDATAAAGGIGQLVGGFGGLLTKATAAGPAVAAFGARLAALAVSAGPILLVIAALAALGYELYKLKQSWDATKQAAEQATAAYQQGTAAEQQAANARGKGDVAAKQAKERAETPVSMKNRMWGALTPGMTGRDYQNTETWAGQKSALATRASGGPVTAGTPYLVGEDGPEIIVPNASGVVLPNTPDMTRVAAQSAPMAGLSDANLYGRIMDQKAARSAPKAERAIPPAAMTPEQNLSAAQAGLRVNSRAASALTRRPAAVQAGMPDMSGVAESGGDWSRMSDAALYANIMGTKGTRGPGEETTRKQRGAVPVSATRPAFIAQAAPQMQPIRETPRDTGPIEFRFILESGLVAKEAAAVLASRDGRDIIIRTVKAQGGSAVPSSAYGGY